MFSRDAPRSPSFLVIRRDNIGDLVLTTPLFAALRGKFPEARIVALVNSYNRGVLEHNPHLDAVFAYTKASHVPPLARPGAYLRLVQTLWHLRCMKFDYAILPNSGFARRALKMARWIAPRHIIGFVGEPPETSSIDLPVPHTGGAGLHEVEDIWRLLAPLEVTAEIPAAMLVPDEALVAAARANLPAAVADGRGPLIALHLSSRKEKQRWPVESFAALARQLHAGYAARILVFWAPGDSKERVHPGDNTKASQLLAAIADLPAALMPTENLSDLIAGLALCDHAIMSDGGAMHIAAALGKPVVCLFGNSSPSHWHPWRVPYEALQKDSRRVGDISADEVVRAYGRLRERCAVSV